jgi:uncharacterized protein (TIGR03435 family)
LLLVACAAVQGQQCEAASIKPNHSVGQAGALRPTPGALNVENLSVRSVIMWAWDIEEYQVVIPPALKDSAETAHYDIVARAAEGASIPQVKLMTRRMLMDRFHLVVHTEKRDIKSLTLVVAKGGPKGLRAPAADEKQYTDPVSKNDEGQHWVFHNIDMKGLAQFLSAPGLETPVVDATGLAGRYTFDFVQPVWNRADGPLADHMLSQVFPELQRQLGLRVQGQSVPMDVIVVDKLDRQPVEN